MSFPFSSECAQYLSSHRILNESDKILIELLQTIQFVAVTTKQKSIYIYKPNMSFPKTDIFFYAYNLTDSDFELLKNIGFVVTFHNERDYWLHGKIRNFYEISWNNNNTNNNNNDNDNNTMDIY